MDDKFADLYALGRVTLDEIDDYVSRWHECKKDCNLHDYLGLTHSEYARWVEQHDALGDILNSLSKRVCNFCNGRRWIRVVGEHPFFVVTPEFDIKTLRNQKINIAQRLLNLNQIDMIKAQQEMLCEATSPLTAFDVCLTCGAKISCCRGLTPFYSEEPCIGSKDWS